MFYGHTDSNQGTHGLSRDLSNTCADLRVTAPGCIATLYRAHGKKGQGKVVETTLWPQTQPHIYVPTKHDGT